MKLSSSNMQPTLRKSEEKWWRSSNHKKLPDILKLRRKECISGFSEMILILISIYPDCSFCGIIEISPFSIAIISSSTSSPPTSRIFSNLFPPKKNLSGTNSTSITLFSGPSMPDSHAWDKFEEHWHNFPLKMSTSICMWPRNACITKSENKSSKNIKFKGIRSRWYRTKTNMGN